MTQFIFETTPPERQRAEGFAASAFARCYGARVVGQFPAVAALRDDTGEIVAAAGYRAAGAAPLFLEAYLDQPVEAAAARAAGHPVARDRIVEIGALAARGRTPLLALFAGLARALDERGFETAVVTATARLRRAFERIGFDAVALAAAEPGRVPGGADPWGSYYAADPVVLAGSIRKTRACLDRFAVRGLPRLEVAA